MEKGLAEVERRKEFGEGHKKRFNGTGSFKAVRGRRKKSSNGKEELFKEPDWEDLKFLKEGNDILHYSQQKHANTNGRRHSWQQT